MGRGALEKDETKPLVGDLSGERDEVPGIGALIPPHLGLEPVHGHRLYGSCSDSATPHLERMATLYNRGPSGGP